LGSSDPFVFKKLKGIFLISKNYEKTNLDIINDVTYNHEKFQYEILYIIGYKK
jgi:hypothetical protein